MSEPEGIGSPGRQKRSTERSRENIREYVKLLGKKSPQSARREESPSGRSPSKPQLDRNSRDNSPASDKKLDLADMDDREVKGKGKLVFRGKKSLKFVGKSQGADTGTTSDVASTDMPLCLNEGEGSLTTGNYPVTSSKKDEVPSTPDKKVSPKGVKAARRASSDSKRPPKADSSDDSDDSPPDLILFLKEGRGRTQSWSEPPTLDAESIATRSRTRVPADLNLKLPKKLKVESTKLKAKEISKKEIKREKSKILDTPESLKRLAQKFPLKDTRRNSGSQESDKTGSTTKMKSKSASTKELHSGKSRAEEIDIVGEKASKLNVKKKYAGGSPSDEALTKRIIVAGPKTLFLSVKKDENREEMVIGEKKKFDSAGKSAVVENKNIKSDHQEKKTASLAEIEKLNWRKNKEKFVIISGKGDGKGEVSSMGQKEKETEGNIVRLISRASVKSKGFEGKSSKGLELLEVDRTDDIQDVTLLKGTDGCRDSGKGKGSDSPMKESDASKRGIRVTRTIVNQTLTETALSPSKGRSSQFSELPSGGTKTAICSASGTLPENKLPLKMSNLVTIAATSPGSGAPVRYRKIHIKIPNLSQPTFTPRGESTLFRGDTELVTSKGEMESHESKVSREEKGTSTIDRMVEGKQRVCDIDITTGQNPTHEAIPLYDFTDLEAEEVIVGDSDSSSENTLNSEKETDCLVEQSPKSNFKEVNLMSTEVLDSSSEDDNAKANESSNSSKKYLLSPEGKVALDHSYSSGSSEGPKASNSIKKKSHVGQEKTLSPRPVYGSASLAKRSLDIMMHNDKINILRQMSQIFNNEKPRVDDVESEEEGKLSEGSPESTPKGKCIGKVELIKNRNAKTQDRQVGGKPVASYVLTPDKPLLKSPSKLLIVEPSPSHVKDFQKDLTDHSSSTPKKDVTRKDDATLSKQGSVDETENDQIKKMDDKQRKSTEVDITLKDSQESTMYTQDKAEVVVDSQSRAHDMSKNGSSKNNSTRDSLKTSRSAESKVSESSAKETLQSSNIGELSNEEKAQLKNDNISTNKDSVEHPTVLEVKETKSINKGTHDTYAETAAVHSEPTSNKADSQQEKGKGCVVARKALSSKGIRKRGEDSDIEDTKVLQKGSSSQTRDTEESSRSDNSMFDSPLKDDSFIGFPDTVAKVHHVSSYAISPDENIQIESRVGVRGESIDVIDGFTFVSFNTQEEMMVYSKRHNSKSLRKLRKKKGKARKFSRIKRHNSSPTGQPFFSQQKQGTERELSEIHDDNANQSSAFASNDLDAFLNNNSRLNISYAIPTCKATEEGVTKIQDSLLEVDVKVPASPTSGIEPIDTNDGVTTSLVSSDSPNNAIKEQVSSAQTDDHSVDPGQQYEEVNAIDILYPKEKYKYYYDKSLCKDTKADGSNVFVRRAGKLVPLTSVFKNQKPTSSLRVLKKTAELVYIYDGGKLLTLGGSLTKINPSNSDSVRARVVLPIGTPPIIRGDITESRKKQVEAVEINEDMAKFALSALQEPYAKNSDEKVEPSNSQVIHASANSPSPAVKEDCKEKSVDKKPDKKWSSMNVKPTKTNILDIIAAKLAMSDDDSDETEDEQNEMSSVRNKDDETKAEEEKMSDTQIKPLGSAKGDEKKQDKDEGVVSNENYEKDFKVNEENKKVLVKASCLDGDKNESESKDVKDEVDKEKTAENVTTEKKEEEKIMVADVAETKEIRESEEKKVNMENVNELDTSSLNEKSSKEAKVDPKENTSLEKSIFSGEENNKSSKPQSGDVEASGERKDEESSSDTVDSSEKLPTGAKLKENKAKIFKKNMYRFPSLSREMKRLNMNFVNYVGESFEEKAEFEKPVPTEACTNDFCNLGCICETLSCARRDPEHCGRIECMFECSCRDESWKHPVSVSGRTMNAVSIFNLDREQMEGLAVREKDFKRTVIQTGSEVILVGAERKKRERRIPGRFRDSAMWSGNDYVAIAGEPETPAIKGEYPGIPISEAHKYIKKCSVNIPWYDIKDISVWCMDHSCYDCQCFVDLSYRTPTDEESVQNLALADMSFVSAKPETDQSLEVKVKEEEKCLEPSCVVVNIDVNNIQARRRYCWRLKEWYHPVALHSSRTCGYSSSKKRIREETKHMTISGQASQDDTPEQVVESVVRSIRYEKSKEYLNGNVPKYFESVGGISPMKLKKIVQLQQAKSKYEDSKASVPIVDLTSEAMEDIKDNESVPCDVEKLDLPSETCENSNKRPVISEEEKESACLKKRKHSGHAELDKHMEASKSDNDSSNMLHTDFRETNTFMPVVTTEQPERSISTTSKSELAEDSKREIKEEDQSQLHKPLSLVEMMIAEDQRGELELDLSIRLPGMAMLVAEGRFRKLINMNIIGVIGINKAGRCIISTVDSASCLRTMQQIHTMICNNALDVGPNMREIFFPPVHAAPRPRFVMIRCDTLKKWEIVGVVQKKGPLGYSTKKSPEQSSKSQSQKTLSVQPQVIDLEEEDKQQEKAEDAISQREISPVDEFASCIEKEQEDVGEKIGSWEGSLPQIASVQGASDLECSNEDRSSDIVMDEPPVQIATTSGIDEHHCTNTPISLPNLIPLVNIPDKKKENKKGTKSSNSSTAIAQPHVLGLDKVGAEKVVPSSIASSPGKDKVSAEKVAPSIVTSSPSSVQVSQSLYFVNPAFSSTSKTKSPSVFTSPITSIPGMRMIRLNNTKSKVLGSSSASSFMPLSCLTYQSQNKTESGAAPLYAASPMLPNIIPNTVRAQPELISSSGFNLVKEGSSQNTVSPRSSTASKSVQKPLDGSKPSSPGSCSNVPKTILLPSSPGGLSKMLLMPPSKGNSPQMVMMPPTTKTQDSPVKMLLVPSTVESGKMVLIPMPSGNEGGAAVLGSGQQQLAINAKSPSKQSSGSEIQIISTEEQTSPTRKDDSKKITEIGCGSASDDVVVLESSSNTLTISKVRTTSESKLVHPIVSSPSLSRLNSNVAVTTVVSSFSTVSSTLPQIALSSSSQSTTEAKSSGVLSNISPHGDKTHSNTQSNMAEIQNASNENPVIEYEGRMSQEKNSENFEASSKSCQAEHGKDGDAEEIQVLDKAPPIKKGGYHRTAVDLSLTFKSVKLEWLLGTIRKNVLVNIYRMSLKTKSPVTLSVKNGASMSMLYGSARKSHYDKAEGNNLPVLILGSVMSAVVNISNSEEDDLYRPHAIKYFIRETTGELASYTYDDNAQNLIKLASKKRNVTGEMVGIGEKISLHSVRDPKYLETIPMQSDVLKIKASDTKSSVSSECSCITSGNFICMGHKSASADTNHSTFVPSLKISSPVIAEVNQASTALSPLNPVTSSFPTQPSSQGLNPSPLIDETDQTLSTVMSGLDTVKILLDDKKVGDNVDNNKTSSPSSNIKMSAAEESLYELLENKSVKKKLHLDSSATETKCKSAVDINREMPTLESLSADNPDCEIVCISESKNNSSSEKLQESSTISSTKDQPISEKKSLDNDDLCGGNLIASKCGDHSNKDKLMVEVDDVDIDIEGFCDASVIVSKLRDQMMSVNEKVGMTKTGKAKKRDSFHGVSLENVSSQVSSAESTELPLLTHVKRKLEVIDRPCPRSKKKFKESVPQVKKSSVLFPAQPKESDDSARVPLPLAHMKPPVINDEVHPGPSGLATKRKAKSSRGGPRRRQLQDVKIIDVENIEDRSVVHNELERKRRKALRYLFLHLSSYISQFDSMSSASDSKTQPKILVLRKAADICSMLKESSEKMSKEEIKLRRDRSKLIQRLAAAISDRDEKTKTTWKMWVEENMQNPSAKENFEQNWQPTDMEKEIMGLSSNECSLDIDTDEGSPLSAPSSPLPSPRIAQQQSPSQTSGQSTVLQVPILKTVQLDEETSLGSPYSEELCSTPSPPVIPSTSPSVNVDVSGIPTSARLKSGVDLMPKRQFPRPPYSYSCLIALAINNSKGSSLRVSDIYRFIRSFFPYYRSAPPTWKNAVRHCLSNSKSFEKIELPTVQGRKLCLWMLNKQHSGKMQMVVDRYNERNMEEIIEAMEYPEFLNMLREGSLKVDYSSSDDEAEEDNTLVQKCKSNGQIGLSSHTKVPVFVMKNQKHSLINASNEIQTFRSEARILSAFTKAPLVRTQNHHSGMSTDSVTPETNMCVAERDDPEVICIE